MVPDRGQIGNFSFKSRQNAIKTVVPDDGRKPLITLRAKGGAVIGLMYYILIALHILRNHTQIPQKKKSFLNLFGETETVLVLLNKEDRYLSQVDVQN